MRHRSEINKIRVLGVAVLAFAITACTSGWTGEEKTLLSGQEDVMRVLSVDNQADSLVLRKECVELEPEMIGSKLYGRLADKMVATVTSPEQDGVGIAGPQVGI